MPTASKRPFGHGPADGGPDPFSVPNVPRDIPAFETVRTAEPPSCIEAYRDDGRIFAVGTYMLLDVNEDKEKNSSSGSSSESAPNDRTAAQPQKRVGSIILYRLDKTRSKIQDEAVYTLRHAVFDLHFHPRHHDLLGVATSSSKLAFFKLSPSSLSLNYLFFVPVHEDPSALSTYFAWSPFPTPKGSVAFAVTFADGWVSYFEDVPLKPPPRTKRSADPCALQSHSLEAWFVAFYLTMTSTGSQTQITRRCLTGGDDATLIANNLASHGMKDGSNPPTTAFTDTRLHTAGVTAILPLPSLRSHLGPPDLILTGSYDEHVRLIQISTSPPFARKLLADHNLGGGVWRLKMLSDIHLQQHNQQQQQQPSSSSSSSPRSSPESKSKISFLILASCMHAGPQILRFTCTFPSPPLSSSAGKDKNDSDSSKKFAGSADQNWDIEVLGGFAGHESMNYGSEWTLDEGGDVVVVSTSFYDRRLCIWRPF